MLEIIFKIVFPLVLVGFLVLIIIIGSLKKHPKQEFMTCDEFIKDWIKDHRSASKEEEYFAKMKKDPSGKLYMPITYHGAKLFIKLGLSPNNVSVINLILSFFILYGVVMASSGHSLGSFTQQPLYGSWFFLLALLVLFTGIIDGIDGAIARLLDIKTKSGAWFDNVIDRVSDTLMFVCLIPGTISTVASIGFDFKWLIWTNTFLIFIYEYMRARHEGLGLHETKPNMGERITRVIVMGTFFVIYGISSLGVLLSRLINPTSSFGIISHPGILDWTMFIYQISVFIIMMISIIPFGKYIWKNLKELDKQDGD
ncbi:MAG: CDP-alcohol phosphatidyltransferase family protein [Promethearchaeota archaeon]|jgi:phosphatidylglycerophosphate synthase